MKLEISLLSIFMTTTLSGSALSPMLVDIASNFSGGASLAKMFLTLPSLIVLPFILFSGFLSTFFSKKSLIIAGLLLYIVSGIGCFVSLSDSMLLFFRSLVGIGAGLVIPYGTALISDCYKDKDDIERVLSKSGLVNYLGGAVTLGTVGVIMSLYWRLGFLIPLLSIVPIILLRKNVVPLNEGKVRHNYPFIFNIIFKKEVYILAIVYFIVCALSFQYVLNISFLIKGKNIGGAGEAAYMQCIFMLSGMLSNILMMKIKQVSNYLVFAFQMILMAQGFFTLGGDDLTLIDAYFASFLIGIGYGSFGNSMVIALNQFSTKINRVHSLSLLIGSMFLGQFCSPIIFGYISFLFDIKEYNHIFLMEAVIFIITTLVIFIKFIKDNTNFRLMK